MDRRRTSKKPGSPSPSFSSALLLCPLSFVLWNLRSLSFLDGLKDKQRPWPVALAEPKPTGTPTDSGISVEGRWRLSVIEWPGLSNPLAPVLGGEGRGEGSSIGRKETPKPLTPTLSPPAGRGGKSVARPPDDRHEPEFSRGVSQPTARIRWRARSRSLG